MVKFNIRPAELQTMIGIISLSELSKSVQNWRYFEFLAERKNTKRYYKQKDLVVQMNPQTPFPYRTFRLFWNYLNNRFYSVWFYKIFYFLI